MANIYKKIHFNKFLEYNNFMSQDNNIETLNQFKEHIPYLLRGEDFHKSLEGCLANIFKITQNENCVKIDDINTNIHTYCLKPNFNKTDYCYEDLAQILFNQIIQYTIPKSEIEDAMATGNTSYVLELEEKAKRKYVDYWTNRNQIIKNEKLEKDESLSKSGEGGEELLFLLAEQILGLPQALCKMNLKSSGSMHFHGADGIHIGLTEDNSKLALYYSEVKINKEVKSAIKKCLNSVAPILKRDEKEKLELDLLNSYLDIGNNIKLTKKLKEYFNPNRVECREYTEVRGLCLVGFNENKYDGYDYEQNAKNIMPEIESWIEKFKTEKINKSIKDININVFFIPMTCVDTFRETFKKKLGV